MLYLTVPDNAKTVSFNINSDGARLNESTTMDIPPGTTSVTAYFDFSGRGKSRDVFTWFEKHPKKDY